LVAYSRKESKRTISEDVCDFVLEHYAVGDIFVSSDVIHKMPQFEPTQVSAGLHNLAKMHSEVLNKIGYTDQHYAKFQLVGAVKPSFRYQKCGTHRSRMPGYSVKEKPVVRREKTADELIDLILSSLSELLTLAKREMDLTQVPETDLWREIKRRREGDGRKVPLKGGRETP